MARISRLVLGCAFAFALLAPQWAAACSCGYPYCSGSYCYCCSGASYCTSMPFPQDPCDNFFLSFDASQAELAVFKAQIDAWSQNADLRTVVDAATALYDSVSFQDSKGFIEANAVFQQALKSLPEKDRKALSLSEARP